MTRTFEERICATCGGPLSRWTELDQHDREHHPDCLHPPTSAEATHLDWALAYAKLGWRVHPCFWIRTDGACFCGEECNSPGKHPILRAWQRQATTDPALITRWWRRTPEANIAVATGPGSGIFVLDVDGPEGERNLAALERKHGPLPEIYPQQWTGSGVGWQAFFRYPEGPIIRNSAGKLGSKIDTRGDGGFVVLPPSNHRSGRNYEWAVDRKPGTIPPDEAPAWLIDLLDTPKQPDVPRPGWSPGPSGSYSDDRYLERAIKSELALVASAPIGRRNDQLNASAHALYRFVESGRLPAAPVRQGLLDAALHAGLPEGEALGTISSAAKARGLES